MPNLRADGENLKSHEIRFWFKSLPAHSDIMRLGFDRANFTKSSLSVCKLGPGRPFFQANASFMAHLSQGMAKVSYAVPPGADPAVRRLHAMAQFLRIISLFKGARLDASDAAGFFLPPIELARGSFSGSYERACKRNSDLLADLQDSKGKIARLLSTSEESGLLLIEKQREIGALLARIKALESVSDDSLRDMLLDWLSNHRGSFNSSDFSRACNISSARAEECLRSLLAKGEISMVGKTARIADALPRQFNLRQNRLRLPRIGF